MCLGNLRNEIEQYFKRCYNEFHFMSKIFPALISFFSGTSWRLKLPVVFILFIILTNALTIFKHCREASPKFTARTSLPGAAESQEPGMEFESFRNFLKDVPKIDFLTDKPMAAENNDGQFLGAQYILVPVFLELNGHDNKMVLIDATSTFAGKQMLQDIKAQALSVNAYGKILAERQ